MADLSVTGIPTFEQTSTVKNLTMSDGSSIRIRLHSRNGKVDRAEDSSTLVFVGGWCTDLSAWDQLLQAACQHFNVFVFESREKNSSVLSGTGPHNLHRVALDLKEAIAAFRINQDACIVLASSWGTILTAHAIAEGLFSPMLSVFLGPIGRLTFPPLARTLLPRLPSTLLKLLRPVAYRWIRHVNREDPVQANRAIQVLASADFNKWKTIGRHVVAGTYYSCFSAIHRACLIIYSRHDRFHDLAETERIIELIPNCSTIHLARTDDLMSELVIEIILSQIAVSQPRLS
ncbi:alpha/beta hydrolase [Oxalobacteraceae bacterium OTU3REALA1]|nr:alpha/beta hydrolase [Oxalobacteraceae bacterium OTU3REALA1]